MDPLRFRNHSYIDVLLQKAIHSKGCCHDICWTAPRYFMCEVGFIVCYAFDIRSLEVDNPEYHQDLF